MNPPSVAKKNGANPVPRGTTQRLGGAMILAAWVLALGLATLLFRHYLGQERNPNQDLHSVSVDAGAVAVALVRNRQGHYVAPGEINGQAVEFLVDTGATDVAIPQALARRLGLRLGARMPAQTANGPVEARATRLERVRLGPLEQGDVRGSVLPHMTGDQVLLGMSFLKRLHLEQRGDTLILRGTAAFP